MVSRLAQPEQSTCECGVSARGKMRAASGRRLRDDSVMDKLCQRPVSVFKEHEPQSEEGVAVKPRASGQL